MFTRMTEAIWDEVANKDNVDVELVAMVPMSPKDQRRMIKQYGDNGYCRWAIALVKVADTQHSIIAWGTNSLGNSDSPTGHLKVRVDTAPAHEWHEWIRQASICLIDYIQKD